MIEFIKHLLIASILVFIFCGNLNYNPHEVVVFEHAGDENSTIKPLVISTKKIIFPLNKGDIEDLKHLLRRSVITEHDKEVYRNTFYNRVITNTATFSAIVVFITSNKQYYANKTTQIDNTGAETYNVFYNNMEFRIYSKLKRKFFSDLEKYLVQRHCDQQMITQLSKVYFNK